MWNPASRYALLSGSSRERRRWLALLILLGLSAGGVGCSPGASAVRLPALTPGDEIYRVRCEDTIQACRDEATAACGGPYQLLESTGGPVEPPRVTSAPGPRSTGPKYQRLKWIGQMVVACGRAALADEPAESGSSRVPAPSAEPAPPPDRLCIPGATQECLGPGACRGAQACLSDGNGYGPCDCGSPKPHGSGSDAPAPAEAGAPPSSIRH